MKTKAIWTFIDVAILALCTFIVMMTSCCKTADRYYVTDEGWHMHINVKVDTIGIAEELHRISEVEDSINRAQKLQ